MIAANTTSAAGPPGPAQPQDYRYDVFVSYPGEARHVRWVQKVFIEELRLYLENELGRPPEIFSDRTGLGSGDEWPDKLKTALGQSRVLVPVWSVNYFNSKWCMAECSVIRHREKQLGFRTRENSAGLIHPVRLFDGKNYPPFAKRVQTALDCNEYNHLTEEHTKFEIYLKLVAEIKAWVPGLAAGVAIAPPWQPEMLSEAWLDDLVNAWVGDQDWSSPNQPFAPPLMAS